MTAVDDATAVTPTAVTPAAVTPSVSATTVSMTVNGNRAYRIDKNGHDEVQPYQGLPSRLFRLDRCFPVFSIFHRSGIFL